MIKNILSATMLVAAVTGIAHAAVDAAIPAYTKVEGVSGNLSSVGSDTLANVMTFWAEDFKKLYPNAKVQVQAAGSATAPPALTQGTSNFGPMSRMMKDEEVQAFEKKFGYKPTAIPVAIDALAIFVHKDNPIKGLTVPLADAIFSSTRKCGYPKDVTSWGDAGLTGAWAARKMDMYGRNSVSGTYGYFKEHTLCKGDFKANVKEQPGSSSVVQTISTNINGIGYSGIGYKVSGVKAVPLKAEDGTFYEATSANAISGKYPLSRYLYIYVNKAPGKPLPPAVAEFVKLILSQQGQQNVDKDGYIPLPAAKVATIRKNLGIK